MTARLREVTMNKKAAMVVAFDKTVAVPRGPNTVCEPIPPNAPAKSAAFPLCRRTTMMRKRQITTCRDVRTYTISGLSIPTGECQTKSMAHFPEVSRLGLSLDELRLEYKRGALDEANCDSNPFEQFRSWMTDARTADLIEPNAMTLSTATVEGRPSGRIVLLKELTAEEFIFYTNYTSRKGQEMEANRYVSLTFYWAELERQVRVE